VPIDRLPVGQRMEVTFPAYALSLVLQTDTRMTFEIKDGPRARKETVRIQTAPLGNGVFVMSWQEADGATVTSIKDFDRRSVQSFITLRDGSFVRMCGPMAIEPLVHRALDQCPARNKALVREAMTALYQRHDASAVDRLYAPGYVQHNPNIPPGRAALKALVNGLSPDTTYQPMLTIAEGDLVAICGRMGGWALADQDVVDFFRIENGMLAEHWDVMENAKGTSFSGFAALASGRGTA
jgi:predicted SnoaL-like aldol condensation-catalyzing enzyme